MEEGKPNNNRGRILLIVLGAVALTFIVAAISSNLSIWRQNDAIEAQEQASEGN
jgi:flagellar basal body-associated protein FliL